MANQSLDALLSSAQLSETRRITIRRISNPTAIVLSNRRSQSHAFVRPASSFTDDSEHRISKPLHAAALKEDMDGTQNFEPISPPSSPESGPRSKPYVSAASTLFHTTDCLLDVTRRSFDNVSPIESDSDDFFDQLPPAEDRSSLPSQQRVPKSSLPVATRDALRPSEASTANSSNNNQPRVPRRQLREPPPSKRDQRSNTLPVFTVIPNAPIHATQRTETASSSLGQRFKRLGKEAASAFENRPPWKGASGREPQMKMMRDDLSVAPLNIQTRTGRHVSRDGYSKPRPMSFAGDRSLKATAAMRKLLPAKDADNSGKPQPKLSIPPRRSSHAAYPSPPSSDPVASSKGIDATLAAQSASPTPARSGSIKRKPAPSTPARQLIGHANPLGSSPVYTPPVTTGRSQSALGFATHTTIAEDDEDDAGYLGTPSRRKVSSASADEASASDVDMTSFDTTPTGTPVMNRKRPLARAEHTRAASASPALIGGVKVKRTPKSSDARLRTTSMSDSALGEADNKPLPLAPPEVSAKDRIQHLDAQLHGLAHRQINLERGIKMMTELMPTDYILASADVIRRRENEKRKIETLRKELAEIQREQHELGFQRHRAYKRLDKEAQYEPTSLWVRRVAS